MISCLRVGRARSRSMTSGARGSSDQHLTVLEHRLDVVGEQVADMRQLLGDVGSVRADQS